MAVYIGIDPGITGAVAVVRDSLAYLYDIPTINVGKKKVTREIDAEGLAGILVEWENADPFAVACVERTHAMPAQGVTSMFSMGVSRGIVLGVLAGVGFHTTSVEPQAWKKHFGLLKADKEASRALAIKLFPGAADKLRLKKHHNRAEALLLARYLQATWR